MQQIPSDELQAIRERCNKATNGDWKYIDSDNLIVTNDTNCKYACEVAEGFTHVYDAQFIAAARTDLPRLLDAYESALKEINKLENFIDSTTPGLDIVKENERLRNEMKVHVETSIDLSHKCDEYREVLEEIDKHIDSRLENVNENLRKESNYDNDQRPHKRKRSERVKHALLQDKSSLCRIRSVVRKALAGDSE